MNFEERKSVMLHGPYVNYHIEHDGEKWCLCDQERDEMVDLGDSAALRALGEALIRLAGTDAE